MPGSHAPRASSTRTVRTSLDFQDPQVSRDLSERPHRQRLDFSLEPWQICKILRQAAYQAYVQRMLDVTSTQNLLKRAPIKSRSTKPTDDDAAYQQYLKRALESTPHQDLIKQSIPNGRQTAAGNLPDGLVTDSCSSLITTWCRSMPTRLLTSFSILRK